MNIRVLLFAAARDAAGSPFVELDAPEAATVADVRERLAVKCPQLRGMLARSAVAIDGRYAVPSQRIDRGAEVALIPPVSGG